MGALATTAFAGVILLGIGCGGSDDSGSERAVEWAVERQLGPKSVRLAATVDICVKVVQFEEPIIEYEGNRVYIELRHTPEEGEEEHSGCLLAGPLTLRKSLTFERELDELVLFDSSTDPPEKRWPRPPWPHEK